MKLSEYKEKLKQLNDDYNRKVGLLMAEYAFSNSPVSKGDIATDHIGSIKVEKTRVCLSFSKEPKCVYNGPCYTKSGKPFKSGEYRDVWQENLI